MTNHPLPKFASEIRQAARESVIMAGTWLQTTQCQHAWPYWSADTGRFLHCYNLKRPEERPMLSICWDTARTTQALLSTYKLTRDPALLAACRRAADYVKSLQIFDPELPAFHGACREETPQGDHVAARDTVEAMQMFINLHAVTGEKVFLDRALLGADWLAKQHERYKGLPPFHIWLHTEKSFPSNNAMVRICMTAEALVFSQLDAILGQKRYQKEIGYWIDDVTTELLDTDGGLRVRDESVNVGHHVSNSGALKNCFTNDDGYGVALIAAYRTTGDEKYKEAAVRYGNFWLNMPEMPTTYASLPAVMLLLLDFYRLTGHPGYLEKTLAYFPQVRALQHVAPGHPRIHGGFKGHEAGSKRELEFLKGQPLDYLSLRTTMYAMLAFAKMAAETEDEWNLAYSGFGW